MSLRTLARDVGWWVEDYAYAAIWQTRGLFVGEPNSYLSGDLWPVVILPGVWETWTFMAPIIKLLHVAGHPVHVLDSLKRNRRTVAHTAETVDRYLRVHDLRDVVFVAHSKGGLIGKYVMSYLDADHRVTRMVAVCSPFSGSWYASYLVLPSLRAFSPRDPTTMRLGADASANARIVSIFGEFDPHIPEGSELAGAENIRIASGGHFQILGNPQAQRAVLDAARSPA